MSDDVITVASYSSPYEGLADNTWPQHTYLLQLFSGGGETDSVHFNAVNSTDVTHVEGPYVTTVQMQKSLSAEKTFTFSSVIEQHSGFRERSFVLSGRTGDQPSAIAKFIKLRNFLEKYAKLKAETQNAFQNVKTYKLVLTMSWERESFESMISNFSYQREAGSTTNSYSFTIGLTTIGVPTAVVLSSVDPASKDGTARSAAAARKNFATMPEPFKAVADARSSTYETLAGSKDPGAERLVRESANKVAKDPSGKLADSLGGSELQKEITALEFQMLGLEDGPEKQALEKKRDALQAKLDEVTGRVCRVQESAASQAEGRTSVFSRLVEASGLSDDVLKIDAESLTLDLEKLEAIAKAAKVVQNTDSSSWFEDVAKFVGGTDAAFYQSVVQTLTTPITELARYKDIASPITSGLSSLASSARALVGAYYSVLPEWKQAAFSTVAAVKASYDSFKETYGVLEDLTSSKYWNELGSGWGDIWGGRRSQVGVYLPTANAPVISTPVPPGVNNAYDAAQRLLGDRSRWAEIVAVNNMQDPYTLYSGVPLTVGDSLLIPAPDGMPSQAISLAGTFGSDLKIENGDLALNSDGSFQIVKGVDNFKQNLRHRLKTQIGSNRAFPYFGLHKVLNEKQTSTLLASFWADVRGSVLRDRRVRGISKLLVDQRASVFLADLTVELADKSQSSFNITYTPPI